MIYTMDNAYTRNKKLAMEALLRYLGEQYRDRLEIIDGLPEYEKHKIYNADKMSDCWSVYVSDDRKCVGSSRIVCISKNTYTICFDGRVGE